MAVAEFKPRETLVCWPWHIRHIGQHDGPWRGDQCRHCACDVAAPKETGAVIVCLYCGMDRGLIEVEDGPITHFWEHL